MGCDEGFFLKANNAADRQSVREGAITINIIEAIESFSAQHSETIEEILDWPWQKFEALYEAHVKREQSQSALEERNAYITGILANTNLDDNKSTKHNMLESIDIDYENRLRSIYNVIIGEEIDFENDPFFKAMKIPGKDYIPGEEATVPIPHDLKQEIEVDQN